MSNEIDFDELLSKYKSDPFDYVDVFAIHTGRVLFKVVEGQEVTIAEVGSGTCPEAQRCPDPREKYLLRNCKPPEADNSPEDILSGGVLVRSE